MLKPNFSHHWGNYALVLMVGLVCFFVTSVAYAGTIKHYEGNYATNTQAMEACNTARDPSGSACSWYSGYPYAVWWIFSGGNKHEYLYKYYTTGVCPEGQVPDETGKCYTPIECPDAGTPYTELVTQTLDDGSVFVPMEHAVVEGCKLEGKFEQVRCFEPSESDWAGYDPNAMCKRWIGFYYTGEQSTGSPDDTPPEDIPGLEPAPAEEPLPAGDHTTEEKTDTPLPTTSETMPDGTTVDQTGGTTTETKDKGLKVTETPDTTTVEWSPGITKTETWTETCTTQADGSKSCEKQRHLSYEQSDKGYWMVKNPDGTTTYTNIPGYSGSQDTTTVTNYDSDGNPTGTTETTSYSGDEEGQEEAREEGQEEGCEANPFADECVGEFDEGDGNSHSFDGDKGSNSYTTAVGKYQDLIDQIQNDMDGLFQPVDGGGSIDPYLVTIRGQTADIGLTKWIPYFDSFNLAALVMAMAALIAFIIVMGVR